MSSRVKENPDHIFSCFCEIVIPSDTESRPWILQKYPEDFDDEERLKTVPDFACPCEFTSDGVQHYSFVLTSLDSKWAYGFCRHAPKQPTLFCFLSFLPWHETFYRLLNHVADLTNDQQSGLLSNFLEVLYKNEVPTPGTDLVLEYNFKTYKAHCSDHLKLPSIPENRNLTEYFNAVDAHNMMVVFASMLHERRILIISKKLSRLSSCVQAANAIIYPMHWQHIFIPVLPKHLLDYLSAPMPFLIGAPSSIIEGVKQSELSEIVVLDADNNKVKTPFRDYETLPDEIVSSLKRHLKNPNSLLGDGVSRAFLRALVQLIGGYREALKMTLGEKITFDKEAFIMTRPSSIQPFLESMLHLQIFQQFIEDRLEMLNLGTGFSDDFEFEVNTYEITASTRVRSQYREWATMMKKEGGMFLKNVKSKTNPAVKSAYKSVKDKSRRAYKDIRSKIQEIQRHSSHQDLMYKREENLPKSAPSSPTMTRPNTFDFSSGLSYSQDQRKLKNVDGLNFSNRLPGIRHYKMLTLDESSLNSDDSDNEDGPQSQPIDMDLMGVLQDIIFRKCSTASEEQEQNICDLIDKDEVKTKATPFGFEDSFCDSNDVFLAMPIPPPRTKKKTTQNAFTAVNPEEPLIKLDSFDDNLLFDPLLVKDDFENERNDLTNLKIDCQMNQNTQYFNNVRNRTVPMMQSQNLERLNKQKSTSHFYCGINEQNNSLVNETMDKPPPLPPKLARNSVNRLSKQDQELLKDYGLSESPLFKTGLANNANCLTGEQRNGQLFEMPNTNKNAFDILTNDDQSVGSSKMSSWQKFS